MRIELHNFGPIKHFTFDSDKDFHVIYGKNNIGKSYALKAVYLIYKAILKTPQFTDIEQTKQELNNKVKTYLQEYFLKSLQDSFKNSFAGLENLSNKKNKGGFLVVIESNDLSINIKININNLLYVDLSEFPIEIWQSTSTHTSFFGFSFFNSNENLYFLPASRSGLYEAMNIFSGVFAKLSQVRHLIPNEKIEIPALSEPISDYFLNLSTINTQEKTKKYSGFAKQIEEKILKAEIRFNDDNKKLEYHDKINDLQLDIGQTSSMVSEMAPLVAHLKYIIKQNNEDDEHGNILFIEEPEAHLHPEIQLILTDIFAELIKHNIKIVITTHSNYIFNKTNNLLLSEKINVDKIASYHMIETAEGSIVDTESRPTTEGIEDKNFVETAEKLYNERLNLFNK